MTLQTFLHLTATIPEPVLRRALAIALSSERPTSPEGYARFYRRVLAALCATSCNGDYPIRGHEVGRAWCSSSMRNRNLVGPGGVANGRPAGSDDRGRRRGGDQQHPGLDRWIAGRVDRAEDVRPGLGADRGVALQSPRPVSRRVS